MNVRFLGVTARGIDQSGGRRGVNSCIMQIEATWALATESHSEQIPLEFTSFSVAPFKLKESRRASRRRERLSARRWRAISRLPTIHSRLWIGIELARESEQFHRQTMKRIHLSATFLVMLLVGTKSSFGQVQRALLTVDGLRIPAGGALAAFRIDTWGVIPLAVCKVPPQWGIKEEKFMDSAGFLSGRSDPNHRTLTKMDQMFLVDVGGYQPLRKGDPKGEYHPASFAGWFEVFDGNGDVLRKRRVFHAGNFHLTAAPRCPDAPPSEP